jgi:hypothetical protein
MKFWVFERDGAWASADVVNAAYGEAPRCSSCGRFIGLRPWLPPYRVRLVEGTKTSAVADVIGGPGVGVGFIASKRFVDEFERANLKGVERWEPVVIEGYSDYEGDSLPSPTAPDRIFKLAILPVPKTRAKLAEMHPTYKANPPDCLVCCQPRPTAYQGVVVDETSWMGADVFLLTNVGVLVVTDKFVDFVASGEFTGFDLVPAAEFVPLFVRRSR